MEVAREAAAARYARPESASEDRTVNETIPPDDCERSSMMEYAHGLSFVLLLNSTE